MRNLGLRSRLLVPLALLCVSGLVACGPREEPQSAQPRGASGTPAAVARPSGEAAPQPAPSAAEAARATYAGLFDDARITLADGQWEGEPYVEGGASAPRAGLVRDFLLQGDLDGDGTEESVALLWTSAGGSGTFDYLAVLARVSDGSVVNRATAALGDRVGMRSADIEDGRIVLDLVRAGHGDAACCPGEKVRRTFALADGALLDEGTEPQGRLSLADLSGEWLLVNFGRGDAVGEGIEITFASDGERIGGRSGCNRYSGGIAAGKAPGTLSVAVPLASTRMACPEPLMAAEQRYLRALANVHAFSFVAGNLVLTWSDGDVSGSLFFVRREDSSTGG